MKSSLTYIYTLSHPITGEVRYIGKSDNVDLRFRNHLWEKPRKSPNGKLVTTHKLNWIQQLRKQGLKPTVDIIDTIPFTEWPFWECHYIDLYKSWGFNLTNTAKGGYGGVYMYGETNPAKRPESRKKISEKKIGELNAMYGKEPWNKGLTKHTSETIRLRTEQQLKNKIGFQKGHKAVCVVQFDTENNFVAEYKSRKEAAVTTGTIPTAISMCCLQKIISTTAHDGKKYKWEYKSNIEGTPSKTFNKVRNAERPSRRKAVIQLDLNNILISEFASVAEASLATGCRTNSISSCLVKRIKTASNKSGEKYKWQYK